MADIAANTSKSRRRWLQFRLKTLLLIVTVLCVPLAWVSVRMNDKRAATVAVQRLGGTVQYDYGRIVHYDEDGRQGTGQIGKGQPPGPAWLRRLLGDDLFSSIASVRLPPERKSYRAKFKKWLTTEPAFPGVPLPWRFTFVEGGVIDDEGLKTVAKLTDLEGLHLNWTDIGDVGLANISTLAKLRYLDLEHTNVTDAGIGHLQKFTGLERLNLEGTEVTNEGEARLRGALPNCEIIR